jgi:hypothetical protein
VTPTLLSNAERLPVESVPAALEPPPSLDLLACAQANIVFDDGPFQGRYFRTLFPFLDEVLRALGPDDPCRFVTMTASVQVGKTPLVTTSPSLRCRRRAALSWLSIRPKTAGLG